MNNNYCNGIVHTVRKGDTLYSLSRQYNVPLVMILRANPYVDVYNLGIGTRICIPARHMNDFDMDMDMGNADNTDNNKTFAYVVKDGESIQYIVDRFGIDIEDIIDMNSLSDMILKPGITIILPAQE